MAAYANAATASAYGGLTCLAGRQTLYAGTDKPEPEWKRKRDREESFWRYVIGIGMLDKFL